MKKTIQLIIGILVILLLSSIYSFADINSNDSEENCDSVAKHALVIGNADYEVGSLRNPVNDATDMARVLKMRGFQVTLLTNAKLRQMKKAIKKFGKILRKGGGVGLFFFAGHGMQVNGINYLIPIGAEIEEEDEIEYEAVESNLVLSKMDSAENRLNMVFLDACRDNPFARSFRSSQKGLASMDAPSGTLIAFATAPGKTAADGSGRNGLFTGYLLKHMQRPGLSLSNMMMEVRKEVIEDSEKEQTPWEVSSLIGNFYFSGKGTIKKRGESLVAILDLEADSLTATQKRAYSEYFRSEINSINIFQTISSTDLDQLTPDKVQKKTGCTRDTCVLAIGKELGAERVISSTLFKLGENDYMLSGRIIDVNNGAVAKAVTIQHQKGLGEFPQSLKKLAAMLTEKKSDIESLPAEKQSIAVKRKQVVSSGEGEDEYWLEVRNSKSINQLQRYLSTFPNGKHQELARLKIEKLRAGMVIFDKKTNLIWQKEVKKEMIPWLVAKAYCQQLNLASQTDWRLPDKDELKSAYKIKSQFPDLPRSRYWSSSTKEDADRVYYVFFSHGMTGHTGTNASGYTLCVRK